MRILHLSIIACCSLVACAAKAPVPPVAPDSVTTTQATTAEDPPCDVVCEGARVVAQPADQPDYHAQAVANADAVIASMRGELLACYKKRLATDPTAHAFLTVDIIIGPDGHVRHVDTSGGARLGREGVACVVGHIERAAFDPVPGGGTRRIQVPLTFRRGGSGESI